jgi:GntR family transcriptional regulator
MIRLDLKSRKSIYEQIVDGFKEMIISGELGPGDRLPSVRELSGQLTVNPNTIQKAYAALENQGWIYTVSGRGCYVSDEARTADQGQLAELYGRIETLVNELIYLGEPTPSIISRLEIMIRNRRGIL